MISLARGEAVSCSNPALTFYAQRAGKLEDLDSLSFEIVDVSDDTKRMDPPIVQASTAVDVDNDCPTGNRLSLGRYAADWTVPATASIGRHEIRWTYSWDGVTSYVARFEIEILESSTPIGPRYALVSDLRDEGVASTISTARILTAIVLASRMVDAFTGRFFEPRYGTRDYDGKDSRALLFGDPVIALASVTMDGISVDLDALKVYGRHLSGMTGTDDRESPKIVFDDDAFRTGSYAFGSEYLRTSKFSRGRQNVSIEGIWGFTEDVHNGSPWGDTPALIRHVTKLIALREVPTLQPTAADPTCREELAVRSRIISEKTRDQEYKLDTPRKYGAQYTGDPEIDLILTMFTRPPSVGSA